MSTKKSISTETKPTPSTRTFLPENIGQSEGQQVVRPKLITISRSVDRTFRYVTVFLPVAIHASIKSSDPLRISHAVDTLITSGLSLIAENDGRLNALSADWSRVASVISKIDKDSYKKVKDISDEQFHGNIPLALGNIVTMAFENLSNISWPRPEDVRTLRITAKLSVPQASKIVERSQSTVRETEIGTSGSRENRLRMMKCLIEWIARHDPATLPLCGIHANALLGANGFVYTMEEAARPPRRAAREYQEVTSQMI